MILSDAQWRDIKAVRWDKKESRRIQQRIHDDKLMVGWCPRRERWVIARLVDATVMVQFGVRTIPTSERAPYVWKRWEDDDGTPLDIRDPRLITYIQRCDLWRQDLSKYMAKFDHDDWVQDTRDRSEEDDLGYAAKQIYREMKPLADSLCGYSQKYGVSQKHFFQSDYAH